MSIFYLCFIHVLYVFYSCFIRDLSIFYLCFIHVLSMFYLFHVCFIQFYLCFIYVLSVFHVCFIRILSVFYPYFTHVLPMFYPCFIRVLSQFSVPLKGELFKRNHLKSRPILASQRAWGPNPAPTDAPVGFLVSLPSFRHPKGTKSPKPAPLRTPNSS